MYDGTLLDGGIFLVVLGVALFVLAPLLARWPSAFLNALEEGAATIVARCIGGGIAVFGTINIFRALL